MAFEGPGEGAESLQSIPQLRKAVDELRRVSGLTTLRNDPRTPLPLARPGEHPLAQFFRLDALHPTTDPRRPQSDPPPPERPELLKFRKQAVEQAQAPGATWDQQMTATVLEYYFSRERLPADLPDRQAIENGANMHITRLLTNIYGVTEFLNTFDLYVKFLEEHPTAGNLRNAKLEAQLLEDARALSALLPYWGRVVQVHFLTIQVPPPAAALAEARKELQQARVAIPGAIAKNVPANVTDLPTAELFATISPIEGQIRDIAFAQSTPLVSPRIPQTLLDRLGNQLPEGARKAYQQALIGIGLSERVPPPISGRRIHAAYINMLVEYRRREADEIIKKAGSGDIPPDQVAALFQNHHAVSQMIMAEHRFGLQTTTAHMFAGTLGVATKLKQNPADALRPLSPEQTTTVFRDWLELLAKSSSDPDMNKALEEQRKKSAGAVRNYVIYMREEAMTTRVSVQIIDNIYIQPAIRTLTEGIAALTNRLESWAATIGNWGIWGPVLANYFPELRDIPFNTDPSAARKRLEEIKKQAEGELKRVQSLGKTIEQVRDALAQEQKEHEPHLKFIEELTTRGLASPDEVKRAQEAVAAIAKIDQRVGKTIEDAWGNIEVNMKYHADTTAIIATAQNSWLNACSYIAVAAGSFLFHVGYNRFMAGRFVSLNFLARSAASITTGPFYPVTEMAWRLGRGGRRLLFGGAVPEVPAGRVPSIGQLRTAADELTKARSALARVRGTPGAAAAQQNLERLAVEFRDMLNRYRPAAAGDATQEALRFQFLQEFTGSDIFHGPHAAVRQELLRRAHAFGVAAEGAPHSINVALQKRWILQGWDPESAVMGSDGVLRPTRRLAINGTTVTSEMAFSAPQSNTILRTGLAGQSSPALTAAPAAPTLTRTPITGKEWQDLAKRLSAPGANVSAIVNEARDIFGFSAREARLIAQSPRAQRIFAGATTVEEVQHAVRIARRAAVLRVVGHSASGALDIFGIVMAYVAFQENGANLERARATGNRELQDFYRHAQVMNVVEGGVATVGLVCSGIAIYGSITGSVTCVTTGAAFVSGTVMLPLGIALAMAAPYRASLDRAAETFMRNPRDWAQKNPGEVLAELERLSRAEYTWGEMAATATNIEVSWNWTTSNSAEYQKWWQGRLGVLEGGARGTRANLCAAYVLQTTFLPQRPGETGPQHDIRIRDHIAAQMQYLNALTRGQYDLYFAQHFRAAKQYADLMLLSRELESQGSRQNIDVEFGDGRRSVNLAEFAGLSFRADGRVDQQTVLNEFMRRQQASQLVALSEGRHFPNESATNSHLRLLNLQRELHGMLLSDIAADIDRFASAIERYDFNGVDFIVTSGETNARAVVRMGVSRQLQAALQATESRMIARGTFDPEEYQKALAELRGILGARGDQLQKLHNEFAADAALRKSAHALGANSVGLANVRNFQHSSPLNFHTADFIEQLSIPALPDMPALPTSVPHTHEESEAAGLRELHGGLGKQRTWIEGDRKELLEAARSGRLGSDPVEGMRYPWQTQERAQQSVLRFMRRCSSWSDDVLLYQQRLVQYMDSVTGPGREAYVRTRDAEAAVRAALLRNNTLAPYPLGESLFPYDMPVPRVFGSGVGAGDLPVLESVLGAAREAAPRLWWWENGSTRDPFAATHLRSINFVKQPSTDGIERYLVTFMTARTDRAWQATHVTVERSGSTLRMGAFIVAQPSTKIIAEMPYRTPSDTEEVRKALGTPTGSFVSDETGAVFRRVLSLNPAALPPDQREQYNAARVRYGPETTVITGCRESDIVDIVGSIPHPPLGFGSEPIIGLQIQGRGAEAGEKSGNRDFLVTYVSAEGDSVELAVRLETGGVCRIGLMRWLREAPTPIKPIVDARLHEQNVVLDTWRRGGRREVGRDSEGRPVYGMRYMNLFVLHRYIDSPNPGEPARVDYQLITVDSTPGTFLVTDIRLQDTVRQGIQKLGKGSSWRSIGEKQAAGFRQAASKGYRPGDHGGDVRLDDGSRLLVHLLALPRPTLPGAAPESPEQTLARAVNALGIGGAISPEEQERLAEMYSAAGAEAHDGHFMLQAALERLAVGSENPAGIDVMGQVSSFMQLHYRDRINSGSPGLLVAMNGRLFPNAAQRQQFQKAYSAALQSVILALPERNGLRADYRRQLVQHINKIVAARAGRPFDQGELSMLTHRLEQIAGSVDNPALLTERINLLSTEGAPEPASSPSPIGGAPSAIPGLPPPPGPTIPGGVSPP